MNSCEFTAMVTGIACCIAKGKCAEEIELLAAMFTQLGDTLATMTAFEACCCNNENDENPCCNNENDEDPCCNNENDEDTCCDNEEDVL